jgi:tetratricopeptide (TPR) repeat protein
MLSLPTGRWSIARRSLVGVLVLALLGGTVAIIRKAMQPNAAELWRRARAELAQQHWEQGLASAEQALQLGSPSTNDLLLAGTLALQAGRLGRAEELFAQIDDARSGAASAHQRAGAAWLSIGHVSQAERAFRHALQVNPENREARLALADLLRLGGRYFELTRLMRELIDTQTCPSALLFAVAWPDKTWLDDEDRARIAEYLKADPDSAWIGLAAAAADAPTAESRHAALQSTQKAASGDHSSAEAFARWGTMLAEFGAWDQLADWNRRQTDETLAHPQVWYVRGLWQLQRDDRPGAIRCFWEALERGPFHAGATYQLSQLLPRSQDPAVAQEYVEQAQRLAELRQQVVFGQGAGGFPNAEVLRKIVSLLVDLGRDWEVMGWCQLALSRHPELRWPTERLNERRSRLTPEAPWVAEEHRLSRRVRLDHFPLPDFDSSRETSLPTTDHIASRGVSFENVARKRGLEFHYSNGSSVAQPAGFMYEISGGGAGILDYDLDGWPDIYLSEGGPLLTQPRDSSKTDRLFRNQFGDRVLDVTQLAGLQEVGYGQGVAVGDVDADGFPDLFVANIGPNRLWLNRGDGTFVDATASAGLTGSVWSMSAALADVDGDGLTDLYVANYLGGEALTRTCQRDGVTVQCRPTMFPPEPDRLWRNLGDGRLADASHSTGVHVTAGKSMGVVAADFDGRGLLSLIVANDMEPNAYFRNAAARGASPQFVDEGVPSGLAFGREGRPLASMGIAVDDVDGDGMLDVYVTNFHSEASNLYVQEAEGAFSDRSTSYGIYEQSVPVMGWGAQFLDANLDGWPDLLVANGHLEDYRRWNVPSQMPTQLFLNRHGQFFDLLPEQDVGDYFRGRYFGRTVAKFDGNRDGREDALVTHVDAPVAWLQNTSTDVGHFLAVRLVGTLSERDAIGTRLTVSAAGQTWRKQLTAGDGFQASNQRHVVFGLGSVSTIDELQVDWPSGLHQRFSQIPADREIVLREGRADWYDVNAPSLNPPSSNRPTAAE